MSHTITVTISSVRLGLQTRFECSEAPDAWCRVNAVGPGDDPPQKPRDCWFAMLASGLVPWLEGGMYNGPPTELRSREVLFAKIKGPAYPKDCSVWRYEEGR